MIRLARAPNIAIAAFWVDALRQAGHSATLERYFLGSAAGELPPDQCQPEIWLADPGDRDAATATLDAIRHAPQRRWHCAGCGELVEGGFEVCWQCGAAMPE